MKVYLLESRVDDVQGMDVMDRRDLHALDAPNGISLASGWRPVKMKLRNTDLPLTDTPGFLPATPIFSRRAAGALRSLLEGNGEFLPLECRGGEFWLFNVTRVIDAVDREKSQYKRYSDGTVGPIIARYVFRLELIKDAVIFKIPDFEFSDVYVTTPFVEAVRRYELTGFEFYERWPGNEKIPLIGPQ